MRQHIELISYQNTAPCHQHDHTQIVIPLTGQLELEVDGKQSLVTPGKACLISRHYEHAYFAQQDNQCLVLNNLPYWDANLISEHAFVSVSSAAEHFFQFLGQLSPQQKTLEPHALAMLEHLLPLPKEKLTLSDRRLQKAKQLLDQNIQRNWQMIELAVSVHLSQSQLTLLFKRHLGLTPKQYLIRLRLNKAKQLLSQSHITLDNIAHQVGIADASSLIKLFKQHYGRTPSQFRV
ncbi:helix-turn-helix domain-containing protein [Marinomonas epiphytica]